MKIQKIIRNLLIAILAVTLFSCLDNDTEIEFRMIPDAIILKKKLNDTVRYGIAYYAYSTLPIDTAEVTRPDGETLELEPFQNSQITYALIPDDLDFRLTPPANGQYTFKVVNKDKEELVDTDVITTTDLEVPEIDSIAFHPENYTVDIYWEPTAGVEKYYVKIMNSDKETIYTGYEVHKDSTHYKIYPTDGGWQAAPVTGSTYLMELNALSYETDADMTEYYYHVNAVSTCEHEFTWNP